MTPVSEGRWEQFAKEDAEFYIYSVGTDFSTPEGRKEFFDSGEKDVEKILSETQPHIQGWGRALEIGCGIGRLAIWMADRFDEVIAVDVAPTMLEKLRVSARDFSKTNIVPKLSEEDWEASKCDLAYSYIVFQHIEDMAIIEGYLERVSRALKPSGVAYFQFDTRPTSLAYKVRALLPDALLPRTSRRGIRRIRRSPARLRETFSKHGLVVLKELRQGTADHIFVLGLVQSKQESEASSANVS